MENGFSVAWAGRNGQVMLAQGNGRVLADGHTGGSAPFTTLVADVPDGPGATFYTRSGDWFAWLTVLLGLGGLASSWFTGTRRRPARQLPSPTADASRPGASGSPAHSPAYTSPGAPPDQVG